MSLFEIKKFCKSYQNACHACYYPLSQYFKEAKVRLIGLKIITVVVVGVVAAATMISIVCMECALLCACVRIIYIRSLIGNSIN